MKTPLVPTAPPQQRVIGDNTFEIAPMLAMQSFKLQARLGPAFLELAGTVAQAFVALLGAESNGGTSWAEDAVAVAKHAPLLAGLFEKLGPDELELVTRTLLATATMDGVPLFSQVQGGGDTFNLRMRGRTIDTWLLLLFALEVHYPDFFAHGRALLEGLRARLAESSKGSSTSPTSGPATGSSSAAGAPSESSPA